MEPIIEMLRDENNAIEQLTQRREEIKRKLEEHRSGNLSPEELEKLSDERKNIEQELSLYKASRRFERRSGKKQIQWRRKRYYE